MSTTVAVIGGGISGLAAAHRLCQGDHSPDVLLLEAAPRLGGVLETRAQEGFLIESAADGFLTTPSAAMDLCRSLGLEDEVIVPNPALRKALVLQSGRLRAIPDGFMVMAPGRLWSLMTSPLLSLAGKLRAVGEYFVPRRANDADESLASFVCRRFGRELFERIVQPLVGGIYTADPQLLSTEATMPRFRQMERDYGSLIRGLWHERRKRPRQNGPLGSGARYSKFATLQGGMSRLIDRLAERLPPGCIHLNSPVESLLPMNEGRWLLSIGGTNPQRVCVDGVIMAVPASHSAQLLNQVDGPLADELREIEYASCAVVSLGYRREQIKRPLDGFGFVVPLRERRTILSCSFSSIKYEGRAPEGFVLLRIFIGGACQSGLLDWSRRHLMELAELEVMDLLKIEGEPVLRTAVRQTGAMPQYHVGHRDRVARIKSRLERFPTLTLAGSALDGVGVPACIQSGKEAASRLLSLTQQAETCPC